MDAAFSPSIRHAVLAANVRQELSYRGQTFGQWQGELRARLASLMGLDLQQGRRVGLDVRSLWSRQVPQGTIEKIVFTAEEGADVPAYVCLPKGVKPPYIFFICLQGHSTGMHNSIAVSRDDETQPLAIEGDRDFAIGCMARGIAALCIEQRSFGERLEKKVCNATEPMCHHASMQALSLGTTLLAERVFDVDRAIDYLHQRGDVDVSRIGVMGNSGGGTTTIFASALLPRIAFAMPSCSFSTMKASYLEVHHCVCNYVPGLYRVADMADIVGLFAPRPVVVVSGLTDEIFPIDGARSEFARLQGMYRAAGAESRCHLVVGQGGHRFYAQDAWPVMLAEIEARLTKPEDHKY